VVPTTTAANAGTVLVHSLIGFGGIASEHDIGSSCRKRVQCEGDSPPTEAGVRLWTRTRRQARMSDDDRVKKPIVRGNLSALCGFCSASRNKGRQGPAPDLRQTHERSTLVRIRLLTITAVSLIMASGSAYAGYGSAGPGWNQVAADAAARAYAAEGKCFPANGPCPAAPPTLHPYRDPHTKHKRQLQ